MPSLRTSRGLPIGQNFSLSKAETLLGRHADCDVIVPLETVSPRHAKIVNEEGVFFIENLNNGSGILVNDQPLVGRARLQDQDSIGIDVVAFIFHAENLDESAITARSALHHQRAAAGPRASLATLNVWEADRRTGVRSEQKLRAMLELIRSLHRTFTPQEVLPRIIEGLAKVFPTADRLVILMAETHGQLHVKAIRHHSASEAETHLSSPNHPLQFAVAHQVLQAGQAILSEESPDPFEPEFSRAADAAARSVICAPLEGPSRELLGVIHIDSCHPRPAFTHDDLDVLASIATLAGQVVEHSRDHESHLQSERLATIGQTLASVAHESRNALYSIQLGLDLLAKRLKDRPQEQQLIEVLQRDREQLQQLFEEVRSYAAPLKLDRTPVHLQTVWRRAWAQLAPLHSTRDAQLIEETGELDLTLHADAFHLEQVFRNLMENSLTACSDPVRIEILCRESRLRGNSALCIIVQDNGPGLPDPSGRVFDAFFTTKAHGTGLGLAIVKRIVETHGGRIGIGHGATPGAEFLITLPRHHAS